MVDAVRQRLEIGRGIDFPKPATPATQECPDTEGNDHGDSARSHAGTVAGCLPRGCADAGPEFGPSERSVGWHVVCLLVVASRVVADEPLIVGANRDEVLERPSTAVTVLDEGPPRILGGRDELSGGTWLAVNEHGVCAGLTNQPLGDAKDPSKRSRGELPLALARHATAPDAVEALLAEYRPADYNGSWLLVGDRTSLFFVDFTGSGDGTAVALPPGIHVLENRALGEPSPKVDLVRAALDVAPRRRRGGGRLPPRPGRPPEPRGRRAAERGQLRPPRGVRDAVVVHRAGARPGAVRPACGWPTGPRAPRPTRTSAPCGASRPASVSPPAQSRTSGL